MAVALFVIVLLLGSLLVPLSTQVEKRRYAETGKQIEQIHEALIGFALANRHFPCPAISPSNGSEDRTGFDCNKRDGFIPWVTLGVIPYDAWDNLIRYSVDPGFAKSDPDLFFNLSSTGDIHIRTRDEAGAELDLTNVEIPAVIISHGKNGFDATSSSGIVRTIPGGWAGDEQQNASTALTFYFRNHSEVTTAPGGQFDDVIDWVSLNQLFARMVSAGRLP
jgi:type II secretory pathway pseudopilin PulG